MSRKQIKLIKSIDLFAGCGGLMDGFEQSGYYDTIAAVEWEKGPCKNLANRLKTKWGYQDASDRVLQFDIQRTDELFYGWKNDEKYGTSDGLDKLIQEAGGLDIIIGGPPCQAYSIAGRVRDEHGMRNDYRNFLFESYIKVVEKYKPKMFVFENVPGVLSAKNGEIWANIQERLSKAGYKIKCKEQNAKDFGVLQSRKRMIIIGWRQGTDYHYPEFIEAHLDAIVNDVLSDLPRLTPGKVGKRYGNTPESAYVLGNEIRTKNDVLTLHVSRPNTRQDIRIYREAIRLWNNGHSRLKYDDLPDDLKTHNNRTSFVDRFKVVEGDMPFCHTILAHLSKDGHYFIHPDIRQHRSISPREAARLQSFPDNFFFEGPRTSVFTQIGNAVPPLMAKEIALGIKEQLIQEN